MNNFLISYLKNNSFIIKIFIPCIDGLPLMTKAKLDTGCNVSCIPFQPAFNKTYEESLKYKKSAIDNNLPYLLSYGISDTSEQRKYDKKLVNEGKLLECKALKFKHSNVSMLLNGYQFTHDIHINYDRTGNLLIGMDILKNFDIHTGISKVNGENVLIGCLRDNITPEYLTALEEHFGYALKERVIAELVRDGFLIPKHKI